MDSIVGGLVLALVLVGCIPAMEYIWNDIIREIESKQVASNIVYIDGIPFIKPTPCNCTTTGD